MNNKLIKTKKNIVDIKTIIIVMLLIVIGVLIINYLRLNNSYDELKKENDNLTINTEQQHDIDKKEYEISDITKENKQEDIGDNYYYFTLLGEKENILLNTNYFINNISLSSKLLPKKMVFHLIEGNKEYTSTFNIDNNKEKVITNVVTDVITKIESIDRSTDAKITYIDVGGDTQTLNVSSGTTIFFNAGNHGLYDTIPSSLTLSDYQQIDITDSSYIPYNIEANYKFNGLSFSGDTFYANYSFLGNLVDLSIKKTSESYKDNDNKIYLPLEYLQTDGSSYINTNVFSNDIGYIKLKINGVDGSGWFGCYRSGVEIFYINNNYSKYRIVSGTKNIENITSIPVGTEVVYEYSMLDGTPWAKINDTTLTNVGIGADTVNSLHIGGLNMTSPQRGKTKIYSFLAKNKSGDMKRNMMPAIKVSDSTLGLFDLVDKSFYTNSGSGNFIGDVILEDDQSVGCVFASGSYDIGEELILTPHANDGYEFVCWNDGSIEESKTIIVNNSDSYYAIFKEIN